MDDFIDIGVQDYSSPRWQNMVQSSILEQVSSKYKLKLKYGGYFRLAKNSSRKRYRLGFQKCIYMDTYAYNFSDLVEEVMNRYPSKIDQVLSIMFVDKYAKEQSFVELDSDENFEVMLNMYEKEKEVTIYVTTNKELVTNEREERGRNEDTYQPQGEVDDSDCCSSEESYHSYIGSDNEDEITNYEEETYSDNKKIPTIAVNSKFSNVVVFKRALSHYALMNEFEYFVEKSEPTRFTARSNKGGNKCATQGWIASVIKDKLKSDGDVPAIKLKKWLMKHYNVEIPYLKVFRGKEQAYTDMYGKWGDSFRMIDAFKEEIRNKNPGSIVDTDFEISGGKKCFQRFFISPSACSRGFVLGCRPYISLDGCHLKGKFTGVLVSATGIDGNNSIFPVAYGVLESENTNSWSWFLKLLKEAIGTPDGLVISSDMQKGLEVAISDVYPSVEHRECIHHLYSNFKKKFCGDIFKFKLWGAASTYCDTEHEKLLNDIATVNEEAIRYLNDNHKKIWSRSKFGTISKCDYITNNISESFNSWIGELRYQPVINLLDAIIEKLMVRFDSKRRTVEKWKGNIVPTAKKYLNEISKNLGEYEICRSNENRAAVKCKGKRWEVILDERKCTCRVWQVKGLPCVHAAAFIAFLRDYNWEKYVDEYFTINKLKEAYAMEIAPMLAMDEWVHTETREKIYPPIMKRPAGRPRKDRIKSHDERKKRHKCPRCGKSGHHENRCKNPPSQESDQYQASTSKRRRGKSTKARQSKKSKTNH